jgi:pimeloyl-ACP methyl ester carboxylesterase
MPNATPEQIEWFNELQRVTTSPDNAVELMTAAGRINIVDLLPRVQCPTLVLHGRDDAAIPLSEGRLLAARIPGARFVELPTCNHIVVPPEPAWRIFLEELANFLEWDKDEKIEASRQIAARSQ